MTVVGISMVKDEADIVEYTVRHMLEQVDFVVVADNMSTDGTYEILKAMTGVESWRRRLYVTRDENPAYYQSAKMTALAAWVHREFSARWVVPFDADEWWTSKWGRVADVLDDLPAAEGIATATLYDHVVTGADVGGELDPFKRIRWRRKLPGQFPKVAVRPVLAVTIEQGNHGAHYPRQETTPNAVLEVRHFPYRSPEQMARKAVNGKAAYDATDLPETEGQHWRDYGRLVEAGGVDAMREVFVQWFYANIPTNDPTLIEDPAP
jgi:glycosyltransferase involved in cell wall biosynthesis